MIPFYDAHCHWHDVRLAPHREQMIADLESIPLRCAVVNGTHPEDWDAVASLAEADPRVLPAFGLHPWRVNDAPSDWLEQLRKMLVRFPGAAIGEVGLDRWIKGHDLARQRDALALQLAIAVEENRPASLHCLQAWGPMKEMLAESPTPERGFQLHGYGGSPEMVSEFVHLGAYFSFSAYVMNPNKAQHRAALRAVPADRLLIETDAPDMLPPVDWRAFALPGKASFAHAPAGEEPQHPANIVAAYRAVAQVRGETPETLRCQVASNFARFFGRSPKELNGCLSGTR